MNNINVIYGINGPVVTVKDTKMFSMMEMVYVGDAHLAGGARVAVRLTAEKSPEIRL